MRRPSTQLLEATLDLVWSHWGGLGVRGSIAPPRSAVDPEALLYLTASVIEHDHRLRDEVTDWLSRYQHHLSRARLTALARRYSPAAISTCDSLLDRAATSSDTSGKARLDHLRTPARTLLRLRCAFGTSARAEILLAMLAMPREDGWTALALADVGYSKRNIAVVLDELVLAGLVATSSEGNRRRYRLLDPASLRRLLHPIPTVHASWHLRMPFLAALLAVAEKIEGRDAVLKAVEARKLIQAHGPALNAASVARSPTEVTSERYWDATVTWAIEHVIREGDDPSHDVPGMLAGSFVASDRRVERPARFSSAVLPRLGIDADAADARELQVLSLVSVPTIDPPDDWAWAVLSVAGTETYAHTRALGDQRPVRFVTWASGQPRTYEVAVAEPIAAARIAALYGTHAAQRARTDQPAVQLRLRRVDDE